MRLVLNDLLTGLSRLVYPPHCLICQNHYTADSTPLGVCLFCKTKIIFNHPPFCVKCSRSLEKHPHQNYCKECRKMSPCFNFAWSACLYDEPLKELIHRFKYGQKTLLRRLFGQLMISFIREYQFDLPQFEIIMPIPLSSTRFRERGYNQARLLAQEISKEFKIPLSINNLKRTRHTQPQTLLEEKQRWTNIKGAFTIKQPQALKHKNILVVDDLLTTGATASEAARVLKNAGASTVGILTLATTREP